MLVMRSTITRFLKVIPFDADFFLDEFRQYQCPWSIEHPLRPPSAANDSASVLRDVLMFEDLVPQSNDWPGYRAHALRVHSVLLPEQQDRITAALNRRSLERRIRDLLAPARELLRGAEELHLGRESLAVSEPWLGAYLRLYNAQAKLSHAHYGLVRKYILAPKAERQESSDRRENSTVVDNARGTTGMDPRGIMMQLNTARHHHLLNTLNYDRSLRNRLDDALAQKFRLDSAAFRPPVAVSLSRPASLSLSLSQAWDVWETVHEHG